MAATAVQFQMSQSGRERASATLSRSTGGQSYYAATDKSFSALNLGYGCMSSGWLVGFGWYGEWISIIIRTVREGNERDSVNV